MSPTVIFQSAEKKHSGKPKAKKKKANSKTVEWRLKILSPLLFFLVIFSFLILANKIVKTTPSFSTGKEKVLSFSEFLPSLKPYPVNKETYSLPELSAKSIIIIDTNSSVVLYQKEPDLRLSPASTTKMMTAIIALENYQLDKVLTVGEQEVDGNRIKLLPGEKLTVETLLHALLIGSANDAAQVLADNFPGGEEAFVAAMNQKAVSLKLENTHFTNPVGLDGETHYSTARDLARLARVVVENPFLGKIVSTKEITITDVSGTIKHDLRNTNELLGKIEGVKGVKTGWTQNAGECLVAWVEKEDKKVVIVVLESQDRFKETSYLIDWVFNNFEWKIIVPTSFR